MLYQEDDQKGEVSPDQRTKTNFGSESVRESDDSLVNSISSKDSGQENIKSQLDLKKKFLFEAPLSFKMNPPPKIVDLTSDFFEKDAD